MSNEYHKPISKMIEYSRVMKTHHENISDDYLNAQKELDHAYTQAAKADEYEAKAKAFDAYHSIISKHVEQQHSHNKHAMVKRFVKIHDEYESGETDV